MNALKMIYTKMIHFTCAAHALPRVSEFVRDSFSDVNKLIPNMKKIFTKVDIRINGLSCSLFMNYSPTPLWAPARKHKFQATFPGTALPPQPIVTRWGTWIEAALYYAENFEKVKSFLDDLDSDDAKSIKKAKLAARLSTPKKDMAFIKSNFECLVTSLTKLQAQGMPLALEIVETVRTSLQSMRGGTEFLKEFERVIDRNNGLSPAGNGIVIRPYFIH